MTIGIKIGNGIVIGNGISIGEVAPVNAVVLNLQAGDSSSYPGSGSTWYDLSGQNNDVTMQGSVSWVSAGSASYFNTGSTGYFNRTMSKFLPMGNSDYTFAAWIYSPSWNSSGIMSVGGYGTSAGTNAFRTGSYPYLVNYWWGDDFTITTSAPDTGWFYAVAKYDGNTNTRSILVNGVSQGSDNPTGTHNVTSSLLQIGQTLTGEFLDGGIGQVWIYNYALTDSDILANFNATKSIYGL